LALTEKVRNPFCVAFVQLPFDCVEKAPLLSLAHDDGVASVDPSVAATEPDYDTELPFGRNQLFPSSDSQTRRRFFHRSSCHCYVFPSFLNRHHATCVQDGSRGLLWNFDDHRGSQQKMHHRGRSFPAGRMAESLESSSPKCQSCRARSQKGKRKEPSRERMCVLIPVGAANARKTERRFSCVSM